MSSKRPLGGVIYRHAPIARNILSGARIRISVNAIAVVGGKVFVMHAAFIAGAMVVGPISWNPANPVNGGTGWRRHPTAIYPGVVMDQTNDELGDEAHAAFVAITRYTGKRSFRWHRKACAAWLSQYVPRAQARGLTAEAAGMRGVTARWLLIEATEARRPAAAFVPLLQAVSEAGWDDLHQKALWLGAVCSYFAKRMWQKQGLGLLLPLKREVQAAFRHTRDPAWQAELRLLNRIEERLHARRRWY